MPHLICFALLLVLGPGAAVAREAVVLPVSCELRAGRLVVYPSRPVPHEIVSERERQVFSACHPGNANWCRPVMLYKFDVSCDGERVPWRDLAAAVLAGSRTRAWVENNRLHITPPRRSRLGECGASDPALGFLKDCDPWELGEDSREHWVLPAGFAPVHEVGARFVPYSPVEAPDPPVARAQEAVEQAGAEQGQVETSAMPAPEPTGPPDEIPVVGRNASASLRQVSAADETKNPPAPAPATGLRSEAFGAAQLASGQDASEDENRSGSPNFVQEVSAALAAARAEEAPSSGSADQSAGSALSWWSTRSEGHGQMLAWLWDQSAASLRPLAAQFEKLSHEREFTAALMGIALLSGLVSGIGWYSMRGRRVRAPAFRAAGPERNAPQFRSPPPPVTAPFGAVPSQGAAPQPAAPTGTALIDPTDERMCGELCRTAHTMLQQIDARVDELQGVAPLRRVLQREMRHLEQFLAAVMTASPKEPEEWRRMRNRLQRIVRELHRLRDIVEGAYRSLSVGGFTSREPPRDKYEAYELLGVNPDVSLRTLKKLVDALRACWHPDLAKDEADRLAREERMKRINIAWDIITSKRQEA